MRPEEAWGEVLVFLPARLFSGSLICWFSLPSPFSACSFPSVWLACLFVLHCSFAQSFTACLLFAMSGKLLTAEVAKSYTHSPISQIQHTLKDLLLQGHIQRPTRGFYTASTTKLNQIGVFRKVDDSSAGSCKIVLLGALQHPLA